LFEVFTRFIFFAIIGPCIFRTKKSINLRTYFLSLFVFLLLYQFPRQILQELNSNNFLFYGQSKQKLLLVPVNQLDCHIYFRNMEILVVKNTVGVKKVIREFSTVFELHIYYLTPLHSSDYFSHGWRNLVVFQIIRNLLDFRFFPAFQILQVAILDLLIYEYHNAEFNDAIWVWRCRSLSFQYLAIHHSLVTIQINNLYKFK